MTKPAINEVLAVNLKHFMKSKKLTQAALASKSGVAQRTIGNYLNPELRYAEAGKNGKPPSAKLTEVERIATAIGVEVWELLRPLSPKERDFYAQVEASFKKLREIAPQDAEARSPEPAVRARQTHEH